jgi:photosystem II stability/assembly factor-like uncharacterized protein
VPESALAGDNIWTWTGLTGQARQIVVSRANPDVVYAILGYSRIQKSTDGGMTWADITPPGLPSILDGGEIRRIAVAPSDANVAYITTYGAGTYRTMDGGVSWKQVLPAGSVSGTRTEGIAVSPADWREVYVSAGYYVPGSSPYDVKLMTVISKTVDGGESWDTVWEQMQTQTDNQLRVDDLVIAPSAPHIVYAKSCACGDADKPLYRSVNAGATWSEIAPVGGWAYSLAIDPFSSNILYGGFAPPPAWKSMNGGGTWQPMANGLSGIAFGFAVNPNNTQVVHAACGESGAFESTDGGASWTKIDNGIAGLYVSSIAVVSYSPLTLLAGVGNAGIWRYTKTDVQDYAISIDGAALFTSDPDVTLGITAPPRTKEMMVSNDGGFAGSSWEPYKSARAWTLESSGNYVVPRTVYVKFKAGGQVSPVYQDDIVLDVAPPTGSLAFTNTTPAAATVIDALPGIDILSPDDDYSVYLPIIAVSRPRNIRLLLSAADDVSGVGEMIVSSSPDYSRTTWEPFKPTKDWQILASTEPVKVYAKYRDRAGNVSNTVMVEVDP